MSLYRNTYSKNEFLYHLNFNFDSSNNTVNFALNPNGELGIFSFDNVVFSRENTQGSDVQISIKIYELAINPTGGSPFTPNIQNVDRTKKNFTLDYVVLEGVTYDLTDANLLTSFYGATSDDFAFQDITHEKYMLNPNTYILLLGEANAGGQETAIVQLSGYFTQV